MVVFVVVFDLRAKVPNQARFDFSADFGSAVSSLAVGVDFDCFGDVGVSADFRRANQFGFLVKPSSVWTCSSMRSGSMPSSCSLRSDR